MSLSVHTGEAARAAAAKPAPASSRSKHHSLSASFQGALATASKTTSTKALEKAADLKSPPKGETSQQVAGHAYADILTGPRNGMFVNTSGNKRNGQAFVLVKRNGREFHIYGTGKDRVVVSIKRAPDTPKTTAPTAPAGTTGSASSASGGVSAT